MRIPTALRRQILRLHYVQRYSCDGIDAELGLPKGTAEKVINASKGF